MNLDRRKFLKKAGLTAAGLSLMSCDIFKRKKPNIIYILADDLGYGELGCYGQDKIETPNIDKLSQNGMQFTQHYSGSPVSAPSRCVLLTGKHSGHAYIRGNDGMGSRGDIWDYEKMAEVPSLEGQRPIPDKTATIAELLKQSGYKTGAIGKWGLGPPHSEGAPNNQGFDFFFGYICQRMAHSYYPTHLWKNGKKDTLRNELVIPHQKLDENKDPEDPESYAKFRGKDYAPTLMYNEMEKFIERNKDDNFFFYWATPIPHVALQAPKRWVDHYRKKFGEEDPYLGDSGYLPNRYPNATYAAMISYLDENIGEMVNKLKELNIYDNTLIIFSSDNGPTYTGGVDASWFNSAGPFIDEYGYTKGFLHEGGIRVPMIAQWPGEIKPDSRTDHISAFWDVMPTLCEVGHVEIPGNTDGISFFKTLQGKVDQEEHDYLYWEFPAYGGQQAVRMGKWKGIRKNIKKGNMEVELYNLEQDIQEQNNVAAGNPDIVKKIENIMQKEHETAAVKTFRMKALDT